MMCHFIEAWYHPELCQRVILWQRADYCYELSAGTKHIRWFDNMSLDDVREFLIQNLFQQEIHNVC